MLGFVTVTLEFLPYMIFLSESTIFIVPFHVIDRTTHLVSLSIHTKSLSLGFLHGVTDGVLRYVFLDPLYLFTLVTVTIFKFKEISIYI